jgi:hypothetical protein
VEQFKYLGTSLANQNNFLEEIKSALQSGNACDDLLQSLSSSLLSKNLKMKIYRTIILPVVFYGCETWSPKKSGKQRLRRFENSVLRGLFGPKGDEVTEEWRKLHNELIDLYSPSIVEVIKSRKMRWAGHIARVGEEGRIQDFSGKT